MSKLLMVVLMVLASPALCWPDGEEVHEGVIVVRPLATLNGDPPTELVVCHLVRARGKDLLLLAPNSNVTARLLEGLAGCKAVVRGVDNVSWFRVDSVVPKHGKGGR